MPSTDYKRFTLVFLFSLIALSLLGKFFLIVQDPINQDEFFYLSKVHDYINNRLTDPFQNFHVYFFQWVNTISTNEVSQIKACRIIMFLFFSGSCFFIYRIGKEFSDTIGALFSALCYICFIFTMANGAGFRSDTIPIFLFLFSLYLMLKKDTSFICQTLSGLAMAIAILFTIKSAIYLIVFTVLVATKLIFLKPTQKKIWVSMVFPVSFILCFAFLHKIQSLSIAPPLSSPVITTQAPAPIEAFSHAANGAYSTFISFNNFFPQFEVFKLSLRLDLLIWICLCAGIILNIYTVLKNCFSFKNTVLFILLVPLFSLLFYRNAFPYFYLFITPTATILCGYAIWETTKAITHKVFYMAFITLLSGLIFSNSFNITLKTFVQTNSNIQNQTLDVIHQMFAKPVPYIDGCSMISSFPKAGFFMSSAGMQGYLKKNKPIMSDILKKKHPLFLISNVPHLDLTIHRPPKSDTGLALIDADWLTLKSNFVHHWGDIWIIGKKISFTKENTDKKITIIVPGFYTPDKSIWIDNKIIEAGKSIYLTDGEHILKNMTTSAKINLKWGENIYIPEEPHKGNRLFTGHFL